MRGAFIVSPAASAQILERRKSTFAPHHDIREIARHVLIACAQKDRRGQKFNGTGGNLPQMHIEQSTEKANLSLAALKLAQLMAHVQTRRKIEALAKIMRDILVSRIERWREQRRQTQRRVWHSFPLSVT